jgi:hypothetical protein
MLSLDAGSIGLYSLLRVFTTSADGAPPVSCLGVGSGDDGGDAALFAYYDESGGLRTFDIADSGGPNYAYNPDPETETPSHCSLSWTDIGSDTRLRYVAHASAGGVEAIVGYEGRTLLTSVYTHYLAAPADTSCHPYVSSFSGTDCCPAEGFDHVAFKNLEVIGWSMGRTQRSAITHSDGLTVILPWWGAGLALVARGLVTQHSEEHWTYHTHDGEEQPYRREYFRGGLDDGDPPPGSDDCWNSKGTYCVFSSSMSQNLGQTDHSVSDVYRRSIDLLLRGRHEVDVANESVSGGEEPEFDWRGFDEYLWPAPDATPTLGPAGSLSAGGEYVLGARIAAVPDYVRSGGWPPEDPPFQWASSAVVIGAEPA